MKEPHSPHSPTVRHALKKARTHLESLPAEAARKGDPDPMEAPGANVLPDTDEADADAQDKKRKVPK